MSNYDAFARAIVKHQESIVGPLAWSEAEKVTGLTVKDEGVVVSGAGMKVLEDLVKQYESLFGQASVEACKDAIRPLVPKFDDVEIPQILQ